MCGTQLMPFWTPYEHMLVSKFIYFVLCASHRHPAVPLGNPLGLASKVRACPVPDEVVQIDEFIKWTLYGIKQDTASPPYRALQVGGDPDFPCNRNPDPNDIDTSCDGIRMTMFYYSQNLSNATSGNFPWNYTEQSKYRVSSRTPESCSEHHMNDPHCSTRSFRFRPTRNLHRTKGTQKNADNHTLDRAEVVTHVFMARESNAPLLGCRLLVKGTLSNENHHQCGRLTNPITQCCSWTVPFLQL